MMKIDIERLLTHTFNIMDASFYDPYVVMNKYDEIPYQLPSDLDMSVTERDFHRLDEIMTKISQGIGLVITQKIWHGYQKCAYILTPLQVTEPFRMQWDFFTDFSVKNTPLLIPYKEIQNNTRKYGRFTVPDYNVEYVFLLMRRVFKNDFTEEHCRLLKKILETNDSAIIDYAASYFGAQVSRQVACKLKNRDVASLQQMRSELWKVLQQYSRNQSRGWYKIRFRATEFQRALFRIKYPVGLSVALLSPDGGGKSSVYENLLQTCWGSFHVIDKMYFRPHILTNPGSLNPMNPVPESSTNPDPHGKKSNGLVKSFVRYFYYNIDYLLGYFLKVKILTVKKHLVVFDRYYYDYFVDIKRYQYSFPTWVPLLFAWSIPKPDLIFILHGTPEVLYARKPELPIEELRRQVESYKKIASRYENATLIDADQSLEEVTREITKNILLHKATVTAQSMKNKLNSHGIPQ